MKVKGHATSPYYKNDLNVFSEWENITKNISKKKGIFRHKVFKIRFLTIKSSLKKWILKEKVTLCDLQ